MNSIDNASTCLDNAHANFYKNKGAILLTPIPNAAEALEELMKNELALYKQEKCIGLFDKDGKFLNPLLWWSANSFKYPRISNFAKSILCIPASQASSERVFSHAGLTATSLRASLKAETVEKLVFLHDSRSIIDELYNARKRKVMVTDLT